MHAPSFTSLFTAAITFTLAVGCARHQPRPGEPAAPPAPAAQIKSRPEVTTTKAAPVAPKPSAGELHAEFDTLQQRIDGAVKSLEVDHQVYATERSWGSRTASQWSPWATKKKDRETIYQLIKVVAESADRQVEVARQLKNPDLAVRAEVEKTRAEQLMSSLEDFNAHDHNTHQD